MVTSDKARTEPTAGSTVNSTGRACMSLAALLRQLFLDMSDTCWEQVTLGDPSPSPRDTEGKGNRHQGGIEEGASRCKWDACRERKPTGGETVNVRRLNKDCNGRKKVIKGGWGGNNFFLHVVKSLIYLVKRMNEHRKHVGTHQRPHLQNWGSETLKWNVGHNDAAPGGEDKDVDMRNTDSQLKDSSV